MKKITLLVFACFFIGNVYAQANADSVAYQAQRKKINTMLAQRKLKFGQYDQSLSQHSGIFGLQTKNDIRHSNDILMDIVKTDEDIMVQTKILLDYRTFQQSEIQNRSKEADSSNTGFMNTINKLRNENDQLKKDAGATYVKEQKTSQISMGIVFALIIAIILLLRARYIKKD
jgi:hypothetical protein